MGRARSRYTGSLLTVVRSFTEGILLPGPDQKKKALALRNHVGNRLTKEAREWQRCWRERTFAWLQDDLLRHADWVAADLRLHDNAREGEAAFARELCSRVGDELVQVVGQLEEAVKQAATASADPSRDAWLCVLSMPVDTTDARGIRVQHRIARDRQNTLAHHLWHRVVAPSLSPRRSLRPFSKSGQKATVAWEAARGWLLSHPDVAALTRPFSAPDAEQLCQLARRAYRNPVQVLVPAPPDDEEPRPPERLYPGDAVRNSPEVRAALRACLRQLEGAFGLKRGRALRALAVLLAWRFPMIWPARERRDREGRRVRDHVREVNLLRRELKQA